MCGEETGLLNALEGKRANPRSKPPFPPVSGLWGKPTTFNNVETLCNVPHISAMEPYWFKSLSRTAKMGNENLWRQRQGQAAGPMGIADGHDRSANFWKNTPVACATA